MAHIMLVTFHRGFPVEYSRHLDHTAHAVSYLTDRHGLEFVAAYQTKELVEAVDPHDIDSVCRGAARLMAKAGVADVVCAPSEYDLAVAAVLRDRFGVPGLTAEQTLRCQDKVLMKRAMRAYGVAAPAYAECRSVEAVRALVDEVGFPVVVKPRRGAASRGVHIVEDRRQLRRLWPLLDHDSYECEEYIPGPIYHVDGSVQGGRLRFALPSRYVNTCLQSAHGLPHGSVVVDDPSLGALLTDFAATSLRALGLTDSVFHLEIIMRDRANPVFLEIGARPGGGEVQQMVEDVYGVDLLRDWVDLQLGVGLDAGAVPRQIGGWLVVPAPCEPPYEVVSSEPVAGRIPYLYYEHTPRPGDVHDATTLLRDRWPGGRFRYAGRSTSLVERAIEDTIARYRIEAVPAFAQAPERRPSPAQITW